MALTDLDEYLIHQTGDTMDQPEGGDPNFVDRLYIGCHSLDGQVHLAIGLGVYPNKNIMDGYVLVREGGQQHNLLLSRHLDQDRAKTEVGPLSIKVLEPHRRWAVNVADNVSAIHCAVEFTARAAPFLCPKLTIPGVVSQGHYFQMGRFSGELRVAGRVFDAGKFVGVRDRSWGVRGGKKGGAKGFFHLWIHAHFATFTLSILHVEMGEGVVVLSDAVISHDDGRVVPIVQILHRIAFAPGARTPSNMELCLHDAAGVQHLLSAQVISPGMYLNGGGYDRCGEDRGPLAVTADTWDVSQPFGIESERFGNVEPIARFSLDGHDGVGILESSWDRAEDYAYRSTLTAK